MSTGVNLKSEGGGSSGGSNGSSHGGDSHGHGHGHGNRSLDGIILHILADISQSLGLTIAGAILWCAFSPTAFFLSAFYFGAPSFSVRAERVVEAAALAV